MFRFKRRTVWQKGIQFADQIYKVTNSFPGEERYGLTSQLRRAAVSVSANIAEGSGRSSDRGNRRFIGNCLRITDGSRLARLVARNQKMLTEEQVQKLKLLAEEIAKMLSGLRNSLAPKSKP